jgi:glutathione S-transferase
MGIRLYRAPWSTNCERVALALARKDLEFRRHRRIDTLSRLAGVERLLVQPSRTD